MTKLELLTFFYLKAQSLLNKKVKFIVNIFRNCELLIIIASTHNDFHILKESRLDFIFRVERGKAIEKLIFRCFQFFKRTACPFLLKDIININIRMFSEVIDILEGNYSVLSPYIGLPRNLKERKERNKYTMIQ